MPPLFVHVPQITLREKRCRSPTPPPPAYQLFWDLREFRVLCPPPPLSQIPGSAPADTYTKLGWKGLMTYITKSKFIRDYWTKSDAVVAEMQIISNIFIILKHIQVSSQLFGKLLMLKVRLTFLGDNLYIRYTRLNFCHFSIVYNFMMG